MLRNSIVSIASSGADSAEISRPWKLSDLAFDTLSSGSAALAWQFAFDLMAQNLNNEYFDDPPPIGKPNQYFGNGYYWATNLVLGIAGGVGSMLPRAMFDTNAQESAYAFLVAAFPFSFSQTAYDGTWEAVTDFYPHADAKYPTDSVKHAIMSLVIFISIMTTARYTMHYAVDCVDELLDYLRRQTTTERRRHNLPDSFMTTLGTAGFMIVAKRIANTEGYKALPIAFAGAAMSRLIGECVRRQNAIRRAATNGCAAENYTEISNADNTAPQQTYMQYLWSLCCNPCGGKSAREASIAEHELNNLEGQTNYCGKLCQ